MFNSPVLDLVVLLSFTYFISSLLLSAVNEAIVNGWFRLRQKSLKDAFESMVLDSDPAWEKFANETLSANATIKKALNSANKYGNISAEDFTNGVVEMLAADFFTKPAEVEEKKTGDATLNADAKTDAQVKAAEAAKETDAALSADAKPLATTKVFPPPNMPAGWPGTLSDLVKDLCVKAEYDEAKFKKLMQATYADMTHKASVFFSPPGTKKENLCKLFTSDWKTFAKTALISNPHIESLMKEKGKYPSTIPATNFVSAIVNIIGSDQYTPKTLGDAITNNLVLPESFKPILQDLLAQAAEGEKKLEDFEKRLQTFYDQSMKRAGGWYKRRVRRVLLALGFVMAVFFNIDTIKITRDAFTDKEKLKKAADNISVQVGKFEYQKDGDFTTFTMKGDSGKDGKVIKVANTDTSAINKIAASDDFKDLAQSKKNIDDLKLGYKNTTGYQMGYDSLSDALTQWFGDKRFTSLDCTSLKGCCVTMFQNIRMFFSMIFSSFFLLKLIGVIITAFAVQLGSDYWFGIMTKAVNIRSSGKKADDKGKS